MQKSQLYNYLSEKADKESEKKLVQCHNFAFNLIVKNKAKQNFNYDLVEAKKLIFDIFNYISVKLNKNYNFFNK